MKQLQTADTSNKNAETGLDLPKTKAYVMEKLTEYGLEPKDCGYG